MLLAIKYLDVMRVALHITLNELINKQYQAIRHDFEPVGPTVLKNPLGARRSFTAYLAVGGLLASYPPN